MLRHFLFAVALVAGITAGFSLTSRADMQEEPSSATHDFVSRAAIGNIYAVEASRIALERSKDGEVRDFAQKMIDGHIKLNQDMKAVLSAQNISESDVPNKLDQSYQRMVDELKGAQDADFTAQYVTGQLQVHADMQRLFSTYTDTGDNKPMTEFTRSALPALQAHEADLRLFEEKTRE